MNEASDLKRSVRNLAIRGRVADQANNPGHFKGGCLCTLAPGVSNPDCLFVIIKSDFEGSRETYAL